MVHAKINYIYICHVPHVWIANRRSCSSHIRSSVHVNSSKFFQKYGCDHIWLEHCTWLLNSNISVYHNVLESAMYRKESMLLWTTLFSASKWTECVRPILLCKLVDTKNIYSTLPSMSSDLSDLIQFWKDKLKLQGQEELVDICFLDVKGTM